MCSQEEVHSISPRKPTGSTTVCLYYWEKVWWLSQQLWTRADLSHAHLDIRKRLFTERTVSQWNRLPQGSGHGTKPAWVQGASGWHSQSHGLVLGSPARSRDSDPRSLVDPFQIKILYEFIHIFSHQNVDNLLRLFKRLFFLIWKYPIVLFLLPYSQKDISTLW